MERGLVILMDLVIVLSKFFKTYKKAIDFNGLMAVLKVDTDEQDALMMALRELQLKGEIYKDEYGNYMHVASDFYLKFGKVRLSNKGNLYIKVGKDNIHLKKSRDCKVREGDAVFVEVIDNKGKHLRYKEAVVKSVVLGDELEHKDSYLVKGKVHKSKGNKFYLVIDNKKFIRIPKTALGSAYHDDIVTAQIVNKDGFCHAEVKEVTYRNYTKHAYEYVRIGEELRWVPSDRNYYPVELVSTGEFKENDKILADIKSQENGVVYIEYAGMLTKEESPYDVAVRIIKRYGFDEYFSDEALKEAEKLKASSNFSGRTNYINLNTFTIDGETAKDLDDGISIEKLDNGNYVLYVHIADVTNYVKEGMYLYQEGYKKGTSVYLQDYVFPMFPKILSNGLCSLNPNEVKCTKTCKMVIDKDTGKVIDVLISNSVIKSNKRMSYEDVDAILEDGKMIDSYKEYLLELHLMEELSNLLTKVNLKRGYTSFCCDEVVFAVDENGYPTETKMSNTSTARKMIENFMLLANETVATYLYYLDIPTLYRNHEPPKDYKLEQAIKNLIATGYLKGHVNLKDPYLVPKLLKRYHKREEFSYLSNIILNSMSRAYYDYQCRGHYGLALDYYVHFTSPIRRFPDIKVHEALNYVIDGRIGEVSSNKDLKKDGKYLSDRECAADEAEREYDHYLLRLYMDKFIGSDMQAEIDFIDKDFIYLRTDKNIDGILRHKGNFVANKKFIVVNGKRYRIGDRLEVTLTNFSNEYDSYQFEFGKNDKKVLIKKKS